jgi:hypothetical protein
METASTSLSAGQPNSGNVKPDGTPAAIHLNRRIFIGPMPEKLVSQTEAYAHKHRHRGVFLGRSQTDEDDSTERHTNVSQIIKDHAYRRFMSEGGRAEDWDEDEERGRSEELLRRWRESEWGTIWHGRHRQRHGEPQDSTPSRWVGGSFEVGNLLGVNVMGDPSMVFVPSQEEEPILDASKHPENQQPRSSVGLASTKDILVTAPPQPQFSPTSPKMAADQHSPSSTTSRTGLLQSQKSAMKKPSLLNLGRPRALEPSPSQGTSSSKSGSKGKKKVHYNERVGEHLIPGPVSPTEVLGRTSTTVEPTTSAAASNQSSPGLPPQEIAWGDVVLRGKSRLMLYWLSLLTSCKIGCL